MNEDFLHDRLLQRKQDGNLRMLRDTCGLIDFVSNDYLGLAQNKELSARIQNRMHELGSLPNGGTGSRLLSGNHPLFAEVEAYLSEVFAAESCLLFNSGYAANQALVASVAVAGDTILYDQLAHVCLKEGAWLSKADSIAFRHNDLNDLEARLKRAKGRKFVVTETVFSMDGDVAPIHDLVALCNQFEAYLIVDEAHSTGSYGRQGSGLLMEMELADQVFARVYTFGKAMGVHGACVVGSKALTDYLINFGRPFIYTTSLPPHSVISIQESFRFLGEHLDLQLKLSEKIDHFRSLFPQSQSRTVIQPVLIGSNQKAIEIANRLQEAGFDVRPILSPTVQRGTERLRISLHTFNTAADIAAMVAVLKANLPN